MRDAPLISDRFDKPEDLFRLFHVPLDLLNQGLWGSEGPLISNPLDECDLNLFSVNILIEVEDVNLNGKSITLKSGIHADVGGTVICLPVDLDLDGVYTIFRIELIEDLHIGCRHA